MDNRARQGPNRVWNGYKTMRVPLEIFEDVRKFMERQKQIYLAGIQGDEIGEDDLPHSSKYSLPYGSDTDMTEMIKQAIREELKNANSLRSDVVEIPPTTLTSQERVKQLLMSKPGEILTTLQIGEILGLPNSTAREATRTIADDTPEIKKMEGRPNKFVYQPSQ